jgi:deoxycytidine triphosphate deaminase
MDFYGSPESPEQAFSGDAPPLYSEKDQWKFRDPDYGQDRKGMLLSNQIDKFCKKGLLIATNYDASHLRPAAYTLTIGNDCVDSSGRIGRLTKEKPYLEMKPNSIVYVTIAEELDLPYYIAARFNLRVKWVYKGILLGTGPQVEPGYRGFLSCPLYNFTNRPIRIRLGDEFATIDFERTTDFCGGKTVGEIKPLIRTGEKLDEVVVQGQTYLLFKDKKYKPLQHLPDYDIVSSLVQMQKEVRTWRNIGIGTIIAFFGLALSLIGLQVRLEGTVIGTARDVSRLQAESQEISRRINGLQSSTESLQISVKNLETHPSKPKQPISSHP